MNTKNFVAAMMLMTAANISAQTRIIAHRGYWKTEPETAQNSIQALKNAQNLGVYGSEFDIRMSKDGILVVNHDEAINGVDIATTPYKSLQDMELGNGEKLPTLDRYFIQGQKKPAVKMIAEIKPAKSEALEAQLVEKTLKMVKALGVENQVEYISFSRYICEQIRAQDSNAKVQYLMGDLNPEQIKNMGLNGLDYHESIFLKKNPEYISISKSLGLATNVWTVNDPENFIKLRNMGVDFVTTNEPEKLMKIK